MKIKTRQVLQRKQEKNIEEAVRREARKQVNEIYDKALHDVGYQCFAVMMMVLHREFGFGKKRLRRLKDYTEDEIKLMETGFLGRDYSASDCVKFLKDSYGIDFSESQYDEEKKEVQNEQQ